MANQNDNNELDPEPVNGKDTVLSLRIVLQNEETQLELPSYMRPKQKAVPIKTHPEIFKTNKINALHYGTEINYDPLSGVRGIHIEKSPMRFERTTYMPDTKFVTKKKMHASKFALDRWQIGT
jgi:hypothetical protein